MNFLPQFPNPLSQNKGVDVLLLAINSRFSHTNLAIRYLEKFIQFNSNLSISVIEGTTQDKRIDLLGTLYNLNPSWLCISCYLWNKIFLTELLPEIKKILPNIKIILGGPEASTFPEYWQSKFSFISHIIADNCEQELLDILMNNSNNYPQYVTSDKLTFAEKTARFHALPFPYAKKDLPDLQNRIIYYESSRGCPFKCAYCLSSICKEVLNLPIERVKQDLAFFLEHNIPLVKFVDRTFNLKKSHYLEIWQFLLDNYKPERKFHFEIMAELLDEEAFSLLKNVPEDYFQFEIGIQSYNAPTLELINRPLNLNLLSSNIKKIPRTIHVHVDLIAGLPLETYPIFKNSFNQAYALQPEMLQLGFLKLLPGTPMEKMQVKYGYQFQSVPPYEILSNIFLSFKELLNLKNIETLLDGYFNSNRFKQSVAFLVAKYESAFDFYTDLSEYWELKDYFKYSFSPTSRCDLLYEFFLAKNFPEKDFFKELLQKDFFAAKRPGTTPSIFLKRNNT